MKTLKITAVALLSLVFFASCEQNEVLPVSSPRANTTNIQNSDFTTIRESKKRGDFTENESVENEFTPVVTTNTNKDISIKTPEKVAE